MCMSWVACSTGLWLMHLVLELIELGVEGVG